MIGAVAALSAALGGVALANEAAAHRRARTPHARVVARGASVETVHFADRGLTVKVVRGHGRNGVRHLPRRIRQAPVPTLTTRREVLSFGTGADSKVTIVRGLAPAPAAARHIETVTFADPRLPAVTVVRGLSGLGDAYATGLDLFGPANEAQLDRIAFAVDGIESRHGTDLRMWRPEPNGPQGPMQVSAAAALDVGGGNRFDLRENRLLGRAYLAQMYRRYGNWPDALAAYNWGPGNMDQWIAGGRRPDHLPPGVAWYVSRALRDALMPGRAAGL